MHGRKRTEYKHRFQDPQVAAGLAQKAQQWYALSDKALHLRSTSASSKEEVTLPLLDKMLRVNPDPLHLWNIRRDILLVGSDLTGEWWTTELSLTAAGLERNPKAYGAWFHRKWVLQQKQRQATATTMMDMKQVLQQELALTDLFLQRDERNFHCWNFRRFLVGLELQLQSSLSGGDDADGSWRMIESWNTDNDDNNLPIVVIGPQITASKKKESNENSPTTTSKKDSASTAIIHTILQREWDFTQSKIVQNFSNFSAFHYRSKLLLLATFDDDDDDGNSNAATGGSYCWSPDIASNSQDSVHAMAMQEWSLMENIMFTEPDDQTIWWYHRFILDWVLQHQQQHNKTDKWYLPWLKQQAETLQVLVEEDDNEGGGSGKWGLLGWYLVLSRLVSSMVGDDNSDDQQRTEWMQQMESILDKLIQVDPDRTERYKMMKKQQQKARE